MRRAKYMLAAALAASSLCAGGAYAAEVVPLDQSSFLLELLKYCVTLPILAVVGWFALHQTRALKDVQAAQFSQLFALAEKQNATTNSLMLVLDRVSQTLTALNATSTANHEAMTQLREQLRRDIAEAIQHALTARGGGGR